MSNRTTWKVVGDGADIWVAEVRVDDPQEAVVSYADAKAAALQKLREHVEPYLARIDELEEDQFLEMGAVPSYRAWVRSYDPKIIVAAKTKKRAVELANTTRYSFDADWRECGGEWWYRLAHEEGIWFEEQDERKWGTGKFYRPIEYEESHHILEQHIAAYLTIDVLDLLKQVGASSVTGVSSHGTAYTIKTKVRQAIVAQGQEGIRVDCEIDHCRGWYYRDSLSLERELPEPSSIEAHDSIREEALI